MKYKSFLLEVAYYWAGMSLEETNGEEIEATDEDDDSSPPTPHAPRRDPVGRLSGDMKAVVGVGRKKSTETLQSVCGSQKT
jgi:hypothetical protein